MPDQDIIDYIRENKAKYGTDTLRKGLLKQGLSYKEVKEAIEFVENEEEDKIEQFLSDEVAEILEEEDDIIIGPSFGKKEYIDKANQMVGAVTDVLGIAKKDKRTYIDSFKYGAVAFLFFNLIVILFRYLGGRLVVGGLVNEFGTSWNLHFPDAFWATIRIFPKGFMDDTPSLLVSAIWGLIVGGVITFLFMRFATNIWPFNTWNKLNQKIFYFYLIFNMIFGFILNISFAEFSFRHLLGYLLVIIGITLASYLSSNYFANAMETKHGEKIREIMIKV